MRTEVSICHTGVHWHQDRLLGSPALHQWANAHQSRVLAKAIFLYLGPSTPFTFYAEWEMFPIYCSSRPASHREELMRCDPCANTVNACVKLGGIGSWVVPATISFLPCLVPELLSHFSAFLLAQQTCRWRAGGESMLCPAAHSQAEQAEGWGLMCLGDLSLVALMWQGIDWMPMAELKMVKKQAFCNAAGLLCQQLWQSLEWRAVIPDLESI